jgi:hypothetical protein
MKFKIVYLKPKKKKNHFSQQEAIFYDERDALNWSHYIQKQNCKEIEIIPVFS